MSRKCSSQTSDLNALPWELDKHEAQTHLWMRQEVGRRSCRMEDGFYLTENEPVTCSATKDKESKTSLPLHSFYDDTNSPSSEECHSDLSRLAHSDGDVKLSRNPSGHHGEDNTRVSLTKHHCEIICNKGRNVEQTNAKEHSLKVKLVQNRLGASVFSFQDAVCEPNKKQNIYHDKIDFSNKLRNGDFEPVLQRKCPSPTNKAKLDKCTKFQHISFDLPKKKKECALTTCPSLDSSLFIDPHPANHHSTNPSIQLDDPVLSSPSLHLFSRNPVIPSSGLASQVSLDSGVLSNLSLDMSQNSASENWAKRIRTASSVSSGTSELWQQSSLDGDGSALEPLSENFTNMEDNEAVFNSKMKKSERCDSLNSCLYVSSHFGNDGIEICAQTNAHNKVDHSVLMPYQELEKCINNTGTVKEKHKPNKLLETSSKQAEKPIRYNINADKYFSSNLVAPQKWKRELLLEKYSPEVLRKMEKFAASLVMDVLNEALSQSSSLGWSIKCSSQCSQELCREDYKKKTSSRDKKEKEIQTEDKQRFSNLGLSNCGSSLCWTPEIPFSPSHRPHSRASKRSSLSFSHDSLVSGGPFQDDSHLITGAVSHDTLTFATVKNAESNKSCLLCLENDIYSLPIDMVKPYNGPILHPKVIIHQPKRRHTNRISKVSIAEQDVTKGPTSKKKSSNSKLKRASHPEYQKESNESRTISKRHSTQPESNKKESNIEDEPISTESTSKEKVASDAIESQTERSRVIDKGDNRCVETTKLCRIMPFSSNKSHRRKEQSNSKVERKKGRSFSSNLRNTLVTLFSFRRSHKENGNSVNAKNEFIDANSQGFYESSDGLKWGKICPLPSAPPLRTSNNSAFTDRVSVVTLSNSKHRQATLKQITGGVVDSNHTGNQRSSSNSISPASLLSCLGHPRTNSINDHDQRARSMCEATPKGAPPSSSSKSSIVVTNRALPPLPSSLKDSEHTNSTTDTLNFNQNEKIDEGCDFASNIEKVKNYGWYWGPISGEAAEKVLSNEPDGSFIVRDSSDYHYIFSLTFRLNGVTSHVRIEHDQGNFSFGGFTRFKSQTIVDFIEKAVEHSRSGRYLFFLHRRPVLGPMRVQLLHPVSRFKHVQSLQHLCRFIIVKQVRKDLIPDLPLPQRLKDYLNSPHYYSEQVEQCMSSSSALSTDGGSPSPKSERSPSPCSSQIPNVIAILQSNSSLQQVPRRNLNLCPSSSALTQDSTTNNLFLNLRCSFPNSSNPSSHYLMKHKSKNVRLTSSHSSLDTGTLQAGASACPISSSTLSSESNSARFSSYKSYSLHRKGRFLSTSSHSSPSSPILFDLSPPDWLSSSDDNLKKISFDSSLNKNENRVHTNSSHTEHMNSPHTEQRFTSFNKHPLSIGRDNIAMANDSCEIGASASQSSNGIVSASALQTNYIEVCNNKSCIDSENVDDKKCTSFQIIEIERNLDHLLSAPP